MRARERLERFEMRRGDDERAARIQLLENRLRERGAFIGIGARAELVQEDERAIIDLGEDRAHLFHERGERREILADALVVADDREEPRQARDLRALRGGTWTAVLRPTPEQLAW